MFVIKWTNTQRKAAGIAALAESVGTEHMYGWGEAVALRGEQTVRDVIDAGGMNPTKKGGARILTGDMYGSAESRGAYGFGTGFIRAGFGINTTTPTHTTFQEGGTRRGITPMEAIPMAHLEMTTEAANSGLKMLKAIQAEWNSI